MSIPIPKKVRRVAGNNGPIFAAEGKRLYVLQQGDPDRADDVDGRIQAEVDAFIAGETLIPTFTDHGLTIAAAQPLLSDGVGAYRYWIDSGGNFDLYLPDDLTHPIEPWEPADGLSAATLDLVEKRQRTKTIALATEFSNYHQSLNAIVEGTFTARSAKVALEVVLSGIYSGNEYGGPASLILLGKPNGSGELVEPIVWKASLAPVYWTPKPGAEIVGYWLLGNAYGEFGRIEIAREVVAENLAIGTEYMVGIYTGAGSGSDAADLGSGADPREAAITSDSEHIWVSDFANARLIRLQVGRRNLGKYERTPPRLLVASKLAVGAGPRHIAINNNGIGAVTNATAKTVSVFDTAANYGTGSVLGTTPVQTPILSEVVATPDGSGFWVATNDGDVIEVDIAGAVVQTVQVGDGTADAFQALAIAPDSSKLYVYRPDHDDIIAINLSTLASSTVKSGLPVKFLPMAITHDGAYLILGPQFGSTPIRRLTIADGTLLSAHRQGVAYSVNTGFRAIVITDDDYHFYALGNNTTFCYGRVEDMIVFDGSQVGVGTGDVYGVVSTDQEGVYYTRRNGSTFRHVTGWPGGTVRIDPTFGGGTGAVPFNWGQAEIVVRGGE